MRRISLKSVLLLVICCLAIYIIIRSIITNYNIPEKSLQKHEFLNWNFLGSDHKSSNENSKIYLSFVVCESRLNESLNVVKSMLIFTRAPVHLVIFADDVRRSQLNKTLTRWQALTSDQISFELHKIVFPEPDADFWLNLFQKCSAQRLFFPKLLPHIDSLIYVDTDTLFLGPIEELWAEFRAFNESQITGLAWEDNNANIAWYPRFAKHPFYGKYGLNSGVMLMNLTRMRDFGWMDYLTPVMKTWKDHIPWGDQDIINIIVSGRSGAVRELPCRCNYRADQCAHGAACAGAAARGVLLLHGSRGSFHERKQPAFRACYEAISEHQLRSEPPEALLARLDRYLSRSADSACGALKQAFLTVPTETLHRLYPSRIPDR